MPAKCLRCGCRTSPTLSGKRFGFALAYRVVPETATRTFRVGARSPLKSAAAYGTLTTPTGMLASMVRTTILTVSDKGVLGERDDTTVEEVRALLQNGFTETDYKIVPDERDKVQEQLEAWADSGEVDLILTTGGTGLAPRDRTPEATRATLDFEVPGLAEVMRAEGVKKNPKAALSRGLVGVRKETLIVNLPGSPKGAKESLEAVLAVIPHAVDTLKAKKENAPEDWHQ